MNWDLFFQLVSILGTAGVLFVFWEILLTMDYGFYHILVNFFKFLYFRYIKKVYIKEYLDPMDWLSRNTGYIGAAMIVYGHFVSIVSLFIQIKTGEIHTKLPTFFISSPLNQFGLILVCLNPVIMFVKTHYKKHVID